jgi:hypothetical protein
LWSCCVIADMALRLDFLISRQWISLIFEDSVNFGLSDC